MAEQEPVQTENEETSKTYDQATVDQMIAEATKGLKAKADELLGEKKAAAAKAKEAQDAAARAAEEAARKSGDTEALEKSWQEKLDKVMQAANDEKSALSQTVEKLTVGQTATKLAAEMAVQGSATVLERLIAPRLAYEMRDGEARVVVRDASGKPSALTVEELKAELTSDPAYAPLIAASKANGGGAPNANGGAGAGKTVAASELEKKTPAEKAAFFKANPGVSVQT